MYICIHVYIYTCIYIYAYICMHVHIYIHIYLHTYCTFEWCTAPSPSNYGVATISRLLQIIGLFCKKALKNRRYSAKETYNFKEPTNRSHRISRILTSERLDISYRIPTVSYIRLDISYRVPAFSNGNEDGNVTQCVMPHMNNPSIQNGNSHCMHA